MEKKLPMWKPIKMGDRLPCQSFLRKKNGEILKLSTGAGVTVGQDAYYLPVDDVIEEIRNYPIEESEDEKMRRELVEKFSHIKGFDWYGLPIKDIIAWLEKQGESTDIPTDAVLDSNKDGLIADTIRYKREKQGEQKFAEWSEEDEYLLDETIKHLEALIRITKKQGCAYSDEIQYYQRDIDRLKSFKERYTWRPSKRQIQSVRNCALNENIDAGTRLTLDTLYQDLLKLKEK